jgi:hypothetical protein
VQGNREYGVQTPQGDEVGLNQWLSAVRRARLGRTTTAVAVMLSTWANPDGTRVRPGLARLAVSCEITYNVAQTSTATLRALGLIRMTYKATGRHGADEYRLTLPPDLADRVTMLTDDQVDEAIEQMLEKKRGKYTGKHATEPTAVGRAKVPKAPAKPVDNPPEAVENSDLHPTAWGAEGNGHSATEETPAPHAVGHVENSAPHGVGRETVSAPHGVGRLHPTPLATTLQDPPSTSTLQAEDRLPDSVKTIIQSLRASSPAVTVDEARAVHALIVDRHHPRSLRYFTRIAADGGFGGYLAEVQAHAAEERAVAVAATVGELRKGPECGHGTPGGEALHPASGKPLCGSCRLNVPPRAPVPVLDDAAAITVTYGKARTAAGWGSVGAQLLIRVRGQVGQFLADGLRVDQLHQIAAIAGERGLDLVDTARALVAQRTTEGTTP